MITKKKVGTAGGSDSHPQRMKRYKVHVNALPSSRQLPLSSDSETERDGQSYIVSF